MLTSARDRLLQRCLASSLTVALLCASGATGAVAASSDRALPDSFAVLTPAADDAPTGRLLVRFDDAVVTELAASSILGAVAGAAAVSPTGWVAVTPARGVSTDAAAQVIARNPAVLSVESERLVYPALAVSDPLSVQQWALEDSIGNQDVNAQAGWDLHAERPVATQTVVAVIDSGADLDHPDLAGNLWVNTGEIAANGLDDDNNGYTDDVAGWDFHNADADPNDTFGHGSHVSGTIAARTDNATGVAGTAGPQNTVRVMPLVIFDDATGGSTLGAAEAIHYAVDNGAGVINVSWGGANPNTVLEEAVEYAHDHGVIVVCAAGNTSTSNDVTPFYPGSFTTDNIIAVAAIDDDGDLAPYSNRGAISVDMAAPGSDILATWPGGGYVRMDGTSMAAPHVSAAVALSMQRFPAEWWGSHRTRVIEDSRELASLAGLVESSRTLDLESTLATIAPAGSMRLAEGATRVNTRTVSVDSMVRGATSTRLDPEGDGSFEATVTFTPSASVTVTSGDGTKTVSARYAGEMGPELELTEQIVLDTEAPAAPTGAVATARNRAAHVTWHSSASTDVAGYLLEGATDAAGPFTAVTLGAIADTEYTVTGLENGETYYFRVRTVDQATNQSTPTGAAAVTPELSVTRIQGADRYATAVAMSERTFGAADVVVVTTGESFADAVVASALAGAHDAPLLFTRRASLPATTRDEIERLGASRVVIVGGGAAVSGDVADVLEALAGDVDRVAGTDRYSTSAQVAREIHALEGGDFAEQAFVVRGDMFPDAVSVAAPAYAQRMPVLLVRPDTAPASVQSAVDDTGIVRVFVAGGQQAVSSKALEELGRPFTRATGVDRYATSVAVAELVHDRSWSDGAYVAVASGEQFPDALSGGSAVGSRAGVVLLSQARALPSAVEAYVSENAEGLEDMWVIGGERALSAAVVDGLEAAAR